MDEKCDALLLRAVNFGESDKMVTLLTAEGKISACMRGVRKAAAKLRFAAQPFCFAEYVLNRRAGRSTVISASLHDGFYGFGTDIAAFYAASCVTELCDKLVYEDAEGGEYLVSAVNALRALHDGGGAAALLSFFLRALDFAGYAVRAGDCALCGEPLSGTVRFDMESGAFCCDHCGAGVRASGITYSAIKTALGGGVAEKTGALRALRLLNAYLFSRTDLKISALDEYFRLAGS